jgi:hypothetical protein
MLADMWGKKQAPKQSTQMNHNQIFQLDRLQFVTHDVHNSAFSFVFLGTFPRFQPP